MATAGGTKDGRENFVLCNIELRPVYNARKGKREIEKKRSGKEKKKRKITDLLRRAIVSHED